MRKNSVFAILFLLAAVSLFSVRVLVVYEGDYEDAFIVKLPFAKKDTEIFKSAVSKVLGVQVEFFQNLLHFKSQNVDAHRKAGYIDLLLRWTWNK